jgi:hypothetical protein
LGGDGASPPLQGEGWVGMVFRSGLIVKPGAEANTIPIPAFPLKGKG